MSSLTGQVVLITGAARGIGAETAKLLVSKGARVVLVDLDATPLRELEAQLGRDSAIGVVADVCDLDSMEAAVQTGVDAFGQLDAVLANAGIAGYGSVLAIDPAMFRRVVDVNLMGVFNTTRAALPHVIERKGYVLVVCSLASFVGAPGMASYSATKAGAEHFANSLRLEVAHLGVKVGSAHMSWIDTPLTQDARSDLSSFGKMIDSLPGPLRKTTSVAQCAEAFANGVEKRRTRVFVPRWVGAIRWMKPMLTSPFGERTTLKQVPELLPLMDKEVEQLGRYTSARNVALEAPKHAEIGAGE